jgi:hypothetical protein
VRRHAVRLTKTRAELNELERTFLAASVALSDHEARRARRVNRRLRALLGGAAALLVLAGVTAVLFLRHRAIALRERGCLQGSE